MLYTIAEISDLIGLSKVSIYKKLKAKELEIHLSKKQGVTYVTEQGFKLIKESLKLNDEVKNNVKSKDIDNTVNNEIATDLEGFNIKIDYINTLKEQLKIKDNQIKELTTALGKAEGLHQNTQVLLRHEQEQPLLLKHINELDDKFIKVRENMLQQQKEEYKQEEKKTWFEKLLKKLLKK